MGRDGASQNCDYYCQGRLRAKWLGLYKFVATTALFFLDAQARAAEVGKPEAGEQLIDRLNAVVDGKPVLFSEVMTKVRLGPLVTVSDYPADEKAAPYERGLQDAINFKLIEEKSKEFEIEIKDSEVEAEITQFLEGRGLNKNALLEYLNQQDRTYEEYKEDFRNQLLLRRFQGRFILSQIKVTDKDLETYYLKKSGAPSELVELDVRQILIRVSSDATKEVTNAKEALAKEVVQKLAGGMAFQEAVKLYSDDPKARTDGGLMRAMRMKELSPKIRIALEKLEKGKFTEPVLTPNGFHIFLLEEKRFSNNSDFQKQKDQLEAELKSQEILSQTRKWLASERQRSKVEIINN